MGLIATRSQTHDCPGKELGGRHHTVKDPQVANLNEGSKMASLVFDGGKSPGKIYSLKWEKKKTI